jgi:2Fe-2S ferredoxin
MSLKLSITDRDGVCYEVEAEPTGTLMEVLRGFEWGVTATCGGACACATCHVYVSSEWFDRLPRQDPEEIELLVGLEHSHPNSRLSCQIPLALMLDGLCVTLAPEE